MAPALGRWHQNSPHDGGIRIYLTLAAFLVVSDPWYSIASCSAYAGKLYLNERDLRFVGGSGGICELEGDWSATLSRDATIIWPLTSIKQACLGPPPPLPSAITLRREQQS